jgi:CHAT domain-containing protein
MAAAFLSRGDSLYSNAVAAIERASASGPEARARLAQAHLRFAEAAVHFLGDRFTPAESGFAASRDAFESAQSPFALRTKAELGAVAYTLGRTDDAARQLDGVYGSAVAAGYLHLAGRIAWFQGLAAFAQGRLGDAQERYDTTLGIFDRLGDIEQAAGAHGLLASFFGYIGDEESAWRHREDAVAVLRVSRSPRLRYGILAGIATAVRGQDPEAALLLHSELVGIARALNRPGPVVESMSQQADLLGKLGRRGEAEAVLATARTMLSVVADASLRERLEVVLLATESGLAREVSPATAAAAATRAIRIVEARGDRRRLPQLNLLLAKANVVWGRTADAERAVASGLSAFAAERASLSDARISTFDESWDLFDTAVHLAIRKGDLARAFELSERGRRRTLTAASRPALALTEVERTLGNTEAILVLHQFDDALAVWLIRQGQTEVSLRPLNRHDALRVIAQQQEEVSAQLQLPRAGAELFDTIVRPFGAQLRGVTKLVVVPDQTFASVGFAGLWDKARQRFLVEQYSVRNAVSASSVVQVDRATGGSSAETAALVFGGERAAVGQAQRIAAQHSAGASIRIGPAATTRQFFEDAQASPVVHLLTRPTLNEAFPMLSGFAVADESGRRYSGRVFARDVVAGPRPNMKLIVIEEFDGDGNFRGKGTLALSHGFIAAGVPSVLGTLPGADRSAVADLMVGFHQRLAAPMTVADALTDLQRNVLQSNGRRLGAWSALVLYGSDR